MRVILAGGSGLVGRRLSDRLAAAGHEVIILTRKPIPPTESGTRYVAWDGRTTDGWGHLVDGVDAIVNLTGETIGGTNLFQIFTQRWTPAKKRRIRQSRVLAGQAITAAIRSASTKPRLLIQMSAVGFYGPSLSPGLDETAPSGHDFLAEVCRDWEAATADVELLGVRRVVVRTGLVLTTQGGLFPVILLPFRLLVGGRLGSGRQGFSWIHAEDQSRALAFLLDNDAAHGAFNLTAPGPVSNADLARALASALHRPNWFPVPAFLLRLVLGEKATLVLDGQFVLPTALLEAGFRFQHPQLEDALADLLGA
jgi:uncharacterized protein (TIGR01777 family)